MLYFMGKRYLNVTCFTMLKKLHIKQQKKNPVNVTFTGFYSCRRRDLNPHAFEGNGF